jgi:hypothetical protein
VRYKLKVLLQRQPIWAGFFVSMLVASVALFLVLTKVNDISEQGRDLRDQQSALRQQQTGLEWVQSRQKAAEDARLVDQRERLDQLCTLFETSHLEDVRQLRRTYRYLAQLSQAERQATINRFILAQLPTTEREAQTDSAPDF